ncbi:MAG: FtsQ-type POTRA domain-containing protein [Firmicutes bacterium]|nr:FtsQ-type POTRA domain-containing protein [Bacillota bacterium]
MKKRLAIVLCILAFLGFVAIIGSTVFRVQHISVVFADEAEEINQQEVRAHLEATASYLKDKSIFTVNFFKLEDDIQAANLRIKCTNIETFFPNRIKITVRERYAVYYFEYASKFYITDSNLHIINELTALEFSNYDVEVSKLQIDTDLTDAPVVGGVLQIGETNISAIRGLSRYYDINRLNEDAMRERVKNIIIDSNNMYVQTNFTTVIQVDDAGTDTVLKTTLAYRALSESAVKPKKIWVFFDSNENSIKAHTIWE